MQENATITAERTFGASKLPNYIHAYMGKFRDKNPDITSVTKFNTVHFKQNIKRLNYNIIKAGILTYPHGETVDMSIRQNSNSAPIKLMPNQAKFTHWRSPGLSEIQLHYGHANDPKDYQYMTHGLHSDDKSFVIEIFLLTVMP